MCCVTCVCVSCPVNEIKLYAALLFLGGTAYNIEMGVSCVLNFPTDDHADTTGRQDSRDRYGDIRKKSVWCVGRSSARGVQEACFM